MARSSPLRFSQHGARKKSPASRWTDLRQGRSRVLVRDMKNPGDKKGNHVLCELPPEALESSRFNAACRRGDFSVFSTDAISAGIYKSLPTIEISDLQVS